jgi:hypothetical protein
MPKVPKSLYGNRSGLLDPRRHSPAERRNASQARLDAEQARRDSRSPLLRALQAAADKALGRGTR